MSLFSWFTHTFKPRAQAPRRAPGTPARPHAGSAAPAPAPQARNSKPLAHQPTTRDQETERKNERMERRELLYTVVRDAMVRAGVLSAGYKFKVLSLDQRGAQFLVMMDLAPEYANDIARLAEIEALITQAAKSRHDILVQAVYWRTNDQIASAAHARPMSSAAAPQHTQPPRAPASAPTTAPAHIAAAPRPLAARLGDPVSRPAPLLPPAPAPRPTPRFEPIEADEVAAFKEALAGAAAQSAAAPLAPGVATRSGPLLTRNPLMHGFEDTVIPGQNSPAPDLSTTQYGELR